MKYQQQHFQSQPMTERRPSVEKSWSSAETWQAVENSWSSAQSVEKSWSSAETWQAVEKSWSSAQSVEKSWSSAETWMNRMKLWYSSCEFPIHLLAHITCGYLLVYMNRNTLFKHTRYYYTEGWESSMLYTQRRQVTSHIKPYQVSHIFNHPMPHKPFFYSIKCTCLPHVPR